jgi:hypothetical protein
MSPNISMAEARRNTPRPIAGHYIIKHELFWTVLLGISIPLISGIFYLGQLTENVKYDMNTNEVEETFKHLRDSIKIQERKLERMRIVSDSAHNILGHMPYDQMKLDTFEFRKVQSNIEAAGAALYLNTHNK